VQEIKSIFVLRQNHTLRTISSLNTKKIIQPPKVLNGKGTKKRGDKLLNSRLRRPSQDDVINIDEHINHHTIMIEDEQRGVRLASNKTELMKLIIETRIPGAGRLF
jgi:hypothetical protein